MVIMIKLPSLIIIITHPYVILFEMGFKEPFKIVLLSKQTPT
jgi:hypothetical protein